MVFCTSHVHVSVYQQNYGIAGSETIEVQLNPDGMSNITMTQPWPGVTKYQMTTLSGCSPCVMLQISVISASLMAPANSGLKDELTLTKERHPNINTEKKSKV